MTWACCAVCADHVNCWETSDPENFCASTTNVTLWISFEGRMCALKLRDGVVAPFAKRAFDNAAVRLKNWRKAGVGLSGAVGAATQLSPCCVRNGFRVAAEKRQRAPGSCF